MDTEKLVQEIKIRFNHQQSKLYLQEKYLNSLTFANQGGFWTASPELIGYLRSSADQVILIDNFKNPVKVDSKILLEKMESVYNDITNRYLNEYQTLLRIR
jgi:hypothetical protein